MTYAAKFTYQIRPCADKVPSSTHPIDQYNESMSFHTKRHFSFERRTKRSQSEMCAAINTFYLLIIFTFKFAATNGKLELIRVCLIQH